MTFRFAVFLCLLLAGCGPSYSPDTYATNAVQQANRVEQGVVVGLRRVAISAAGAVGAVSGAAAGGIAGSQVGTGPITPFTALGGSLIGGLAGSAVEHATGDTIGFEYIVRKPNGDLVSVTQKDEVPLALGQKVLVIAGTQARVVPDYTVGPPVTLNPRADAAPQPEKTIPAAATEANTSVQDNATVSTGTPAEAAAVKSADEPRPPSIP